MIEERVLKAIMEFPDDSSLRLFVDNELTFYKKHFGQFNSSVIREKKVLEFENPNRLKITFEFDVNGLKGEKTPMFIFLPDTRKNWLKIIWKGRRLSVASAEEIKKSVWEVVKKDVESLVKRISEDDAESVWFNKIWGDKNRIPCFINGEGIEGDGQLVVEFYDSYANYKSLGKLLDERQYVYKYAFEAGKSHWIYVKAPERFQINLKTTDSRAEEIKGNDPEIKAYRIFHLNEKEPVEFTVDILVPRTLKWWYRMIVAMSTAFIIAFFIIGLKLIKHPITPAFAQVGIALVTAVIATRGWIMNDETVLKRVSNTMTILSIIILILLVVFYSLNGFLSSN